MAIKVLIVDDNEDFTYTMEKGLKSVSDEYEIYLANSGKACLTNIQKHKPHIVLLDIMMPDMDGWKVAENLQKNSNFSNIPIIIITAITEQISHTVGTLGVKDYIVKPIDVKDLDMRIRRILNL